MATRHVQEGDAAGGDLDGTYPNPTINPASVAPASAGVKAGGTTGQVYTKNSATDNDAGWQTPTTSPVSSVFGRTGAVAAAANDYNASQIANTPAGGISATNVQTALNELDSEKQTTNTDLTAIGSLAPSNDDIIQRKAGVWTNRTPSQLKTDMSLNNVTNDAQLPLSYLDTDDTLAANSDVKVASQKATKTYITNNAAGLQNKGASRLATTAALPANTYNNGASGVGATLTASANGALSVDGVAVAVSDRVIVKNEATTANNGIYTVTQTGDGSNPYILTRATNMDSASEIGSAYSFVTEGTANANTGWNVNGGSYTVGTTAITWNQFSSGQTNFTEGAGIDIAGNVISAEFGTTANTVTEGDDARLSDARTPTGSAGGDLTGTYPNPTLASVGAQSLLRGFGGVYIPKRGLDIWNNKGYSGLRNIICFGDSLTQGGGRIGTSLASPATNDLNTTANSNVVSSVSAAFTAADVGAQFHGDNIPANTTIMAISGNTATLSNAATGTTTTGAYVIYAENWVRRIRNYFKNFGPVHYGFVGPWRGDFIGAGLYTKHRSPAEITSTDPVTPWGQYGSTSTSDFMPFSQQFLSPASGATTVARVGNTMTTVAGSTTVTCSGGAFVSTDVGKLFMGTGIPTDTVVEEVLATNQVRLSQAATSSGAARNWRLEGPHVMWRKPDDVTCASFDILWVDNSSASGSFSYSTNGGATWTNVATSAPATPVLKRTVINATPSTDTIIIRAYNATGAPNVLGTFARFTFAGFNIFSTGTLTRTGYAVHNVGYAGNTLRSGTREFYTITDLVTTAGSPTATSASANFRTWQNSKEIKSANIPAGTSYTVVNDTTITLSANATSSGTSTATIGSQGDPYAWLDNNGTGWQGIKPDLVIVGFLNDKTLFADPTRYTTTLKRLYDRFSGYADMLVWEVYEPTKTPDWRDLTNVVTNGTTTVTCATGAFTAGDVNSAISGTNIKDNQAASGPVTITAVNSSTNITISTPATGSSSTGTLTIGSSPNNLANYRSAVRSWANTNNIAVIDLYDAFAAEGVVGGAAMISEGYMNTAEQVHPSQKGNTNIGARFIRLLNLYA